MALYKNDANEVLASLKQIKISETISPPVTEIEEMSNIMSQIDNSNYNILDLFQDINELLETLSSIVISPNNIGSPFFNVTVNESIPVDMASEVVQYIKDKIVDGELKLKDNIDTIVHEALCTRGSFVYMLVPTTIIEKIRELKKSNGKKKDVRESFLVSGKENLPFDIPDKLLSGINITDSLETLFEDDFNTYNKFEDTAKSYVDTYGLESFDTKDILDIGQFIDANDENVKVKKIRHERVIPVIDPDDPSRHVGYFITSKKRKERSDSDFNLLELEKLSANLKKARANINLLVNDKQLSNSKDIYKFGVAKLLEGSIKHGKVEVRVTEALDVIIDDMINGFNVDIVYVPEFMIQYFCFDFRHNGTGRSLLEKVLPLTSIRAVLWMADIVNTIKASVPATIVNADLDERIVDQAKTRKQIINSFLKYNSNNLPIMGMIDLNHLTTWAQTMGITFNIRGSDLPNINLDVEHNNMNKMIDISESDNRIKKAIAMAFNLPPEFSDSDFVQERAVAIVESNKMLKKRVIRYQNTVNKQISNLVRKLVRLDKNHYDQIKEIVNKYKNKMIKRGGSDTGLQVKTIVNTVISKLEISLPEPESKSNPEVMGDMFDKVSDNIDKAFDVIFSDDLYTRDLMPEGSDNIAAYRAAFKTLLMREWMSKNGYMDGIERLLNQDDNVIEEVISMMKETSKKLGKAGKSINRIMNRLDKRITGQEPENNDNNPNDNSNEPPSSHNEPPEDNNSNKTSNNNKDMDTPDELTPPTF